MTFKFTVAGTDRSDHVDPGSLNLNMPVSRNGSTARFRIFDETRTLLVSPLSTVSITDWDGVTALFSGLVTSPKVSTPAPGMNVWDLTCVDDSYYLERILANVAYTNQAADVIVKDLASTYASWLGTTDVQAGPVIPYVSFSHRTLGESLRKLSGLAQQTDPVAWWVDAAHGLHWGALSQLPAAPIWLSNADADIAAGAVEYELSSFSYTTDGKQITNRVVVRGGTMLSNTFTDNFQGDGTKASFVLSYQPSLNNAAATPTVTVGGVSQTVAFDNGLTPTTQWVLTPSSPGVPAALRVGTASAPGAGVAVVCTYQYDLPVLAVVQDPASQAEYAGGLTAGVYGVQITDSTIATFDAARARGQSYLQSHAYHVPTAHAVITEQYTGVGLLPGQQIRLVNAQTGIDATLAITNMRVIGTPGGKRRIELDLEGS